MVFSISYKNSSPDLGRSCCFYIYYINISSEEMWKAPVLIANGHFYQQYVLCKLYCTVCISPCEDKQKDIAEVEASADNAHYKWKHRENGHNDAPYKRIPAVLFEKSVKSHSAEAYSRESDADDVSEHSERCSALCHGEKRPAHNTKHQ